MTGSFFGSVSTPIIVFFAILTGLKVGSFGSVLVARIPTGKSLSTSSECRECGYQIRSLEKIPVVSFLLLRGRCSHCEEKISILYPVIELATAVIFLISIFVFHNWTQLLLFLILAIFGIPLTIIDATLHRLPDILTGSLFIASAGVIIGDALDHHQYDRLIPSLIGALALPGFYLALVIISRGGMGMGDVKLSAGLGLVAGYFGLRIVLVGSCAAYILGSFVGVGLMILGKADRKTAIPFGPFMLVGQAIALIVATRSGL